MKIDEFIAKINNSITVTRVFGEPIMTNGVTVIPVAKVMGGGGGGGGPETNEYAGEGGGFGVMAQPAGTYVIKNGEVRWMPALDYNRIITLGAALAIVTMRGRRRRRR